MSLASEHPVKFLKSLFGANARKHEDKADELRLDFEYRDAAYYYQQALEATEPEDEESAERLKRKIREVRRQAFSQLLEDTSELLRQDALEMALEKLELAAGFADDEASRHEIARRREEIEELLGEVAPPPPVEEPDLVSATDDEIFELSLIGYEPEDRERALALGEPFRLAFQAGQEEAWEDALVRTRELLETHPDEPVLLEFAAGAAENLGRDDEALEFWNRCQEAAPFRPATIQGLVALHRKAERTAEVRNLLTRAVAVRSVGSNLSEAWVQIHLDHALTLSEDGHHNEAASTILALTGVKTADRPYLFFNLAGVLERAGRDEEARSALVKAIDGAPGRSLYLERLADFLLKRQIELDTALKLLVAANEAETTGGASLLGGGASKAIQSPHRARYLYKIARVYFLKGEDLEAERIVTTALAISRYPDVTQALEDLREEMRASRASGASGEPKTV